MSTATGKGRIRIVVAKPGLDGHDRGAKIVARALRDAGMEVIYTGLHRKPAEVVAAAVQEDADAIGVSILSGAHMSVFPRLIAEMKRAGIWEDVVLIGGGLVPDDEVAELKRLGVHGVVGQDATPEQVVAAVRDAVEARRAHA